MAGNNVGQIAAVILMVVLGWQQGYAGQEVEPPESQLLPLYEYGVIGIASTLPHYRGSDESTNYYFPLPYFIYRGEWFKANREGVRGIFWRSKRFTTEISLSGNPPVSDDNQAREGMDELDALVEIGPALRFYFWDAGEWNSFYMQANVRAATSFGFDDGLDAAYQGYTSELSMTYLNATLLKRQNIKFHLNGGFKFSDSEFHSYFYDVSSEFATADRAEYHADGGYSGMHVSGSIQKEISAKLRFGVYGRWANNNGTVYKDSPLMLEDNNYILGAMLVWKIGESEEKESLAGRIAK